MKTFGIISSTWHLLFVKRNNIVNNGISQIANN